MIDPNNVYKLYQQHLLIYEAIGAHRPEVAKKQMAQHLGFVLEIS